MMTDFDSSLAEILGSDWIASGSSTPCRPRLIDDGRIAFGETVFPLSSVANARPSARAGRQAFTAIHDGWKIVSFEKYNPLIYYAAFGGMDIFECLRLSVRSVLTYGQWRHDILVLTTADQAGIVDRLLAPLGLGRRLHIVTVEARDTLDWCCARYRLHASPVFQRAQPVLYLDTDVICDRPLEDFMVATMRSDQIQVRAEGRMDEGNPASAGHWFGWRLMAEDGVSFDPSGPGFSSGAIGFAHAAGAADCFDAILASAYGYAEAHGKRDLLAGYDQPFANYVLRKLGHFETGLLEGVLRLHRVAPRSVTCPSVDAASGLVHFTGGVGMASPKRVAMARYLDSLLARAS